MQALPESFHVIKAVPAHTQADPAVATRAVQAMVDAQQNGEKPSPKALARHLKDVRIKRIAGPLYADQVKAVQAGQASPGSEWGDLPADFFQGDHVPVVSPEQVLANPELTKGNYVIVPSEAGWLRSAMELTRSQDVHRPIILGIEDPTPQEIEEHLQYEANRHPVMRLLDLYLSPKFWERDGRLYEWLGVRICKFLVTEVIGKGIKRILYSLIPKVSLERGNKPKKHRTTSSELVERMAELRPKSDGYFLEERTIAGLRELEVDNYSWDGIHFSAFVLANYVLIRYSHIIPWDDPATVAQFFAVHAGNTYTWMLQRYNRARYRNTIDLKLGRGDFEM